MVAGYENDTKILATAPVLFATETTYTVYLICVTTSYYKLLPKLCFKKSIWQFFYVTTTRKKIGKKRGQNL